MYFEYDIFDETKAMKSAETTATASVENYARSYNVKILNSFNPEIQLKNNEFPIKNKLKIC